MRKVLAILFLSTYLLSTTTLNQLLKLPVLFEHYYEHKTQKEDISIIEFLAIHYKGNHLDNHPFNHDYEQDQRLPFFNHLDFLSVNVVISPNSTFTLLANVSNPKVTNSPPLDDINIESSFLNSIWQPPKFC